MYLVQMFEELYSDFWNPAFWLPPNVNWTDLDPNTKPGFPNSKHLFIPIPAAAFLLCLRIICESYLFAPIAHAIGIKYTKIKKAVQNPKLEAVYLRKKKLKYIELVDLSKNLDLSERQIERWWRLRCAQDKPSTLVKFCESSWRWLYYTYSFWYGLYCLWDKKWFWDINECWYSYPFQIVSTDCWWYYMSSLTFYWSLFFSQFLDVKRKDFKLMFIHHLATVMLLSLSWICNLCRVGTLVLLIHDCADSLLEVSKLAKYAQYQTFCDIVFMIFTTVWVITRLAIFPFGIVKNTTYDALQVVPIFPAYYVFNAMLFLLLVMHIIWTEIVLKVAINILKSGHMEDTRSSSSLPEGTSDDNEFCKPNVNTVGNERILENK